ncbi:MAG: hypothetical protein AVDCRST_MAG18-4126, partial [uncultured Thermomicrobiales bacterium]
CPANDSRFTIVSAPAAAGWPCWSKIPPVNSTSTPEWACARICARTPTPRVARRRCAVSAGCRSRASPPTPSTAYSASSD